MPRRNKFKPDDRPLTYMDDVAMCLRYGKWIYLHGRPKHPSIIASMQFRTVMGFIERRMLYMAKVNHA